MVDLSRIQRQLGEFMAESMDANEEWYTEGIETMPEKFQPKPEDLENLSLKTVMLLYTATDGSRSMKMKKIDQDGDMVEMNAWEILTELSLFQAQVIAMAEAGGLET